jgi:hypothetical protein
LQVDNNEKVGKLIQDVPTIWQTKADSLASLLYLKADVQEVIRYGIEVLNRNDLNDAALTDAEWDVIEEVQPTFARLRHVIIKTIHHSIQVVVSCLFHSSMLCDYSVFTFLHV